MKKFGIVVCLLLIPLAYALAENAQSTGWILGDGQIYTGPCLLHGAQLNAVQVGRVDGRMIVYDGTDTTGKCILEMSILSSASQ